MYRFIKDWRSYHQGQLADLDKVGMMKDQIDILLKRNIITYVFESKADYVAMIEEQPQVMVKRRGRPPGSKNRPKSGL